MGEGLDGDHSGVPVTTNSVRVGRGAPSLRLAPSSVSPSFHVVPVGHRQLIIIFNNDISNFVHQPGLTVYDLDVNDNFNWDPFGSRMNGIVMDRDNLQVHYAWTDVGGNFDAGYVEEQLGREALTGRLVHVGNWPQQHFIIPTSEYRLTPLVSDAFLIVDRCPVNFGDPQFIETRNPQNFFDVQESTLVNFANPQQISGAHTSGVSLDGRTAWVAQYANIVGSPTHLYRVDRDSSTSTLVTDLRPIASSFVPDLDPVALVTVRWIAVRADGAPFVLVELTGGSASYLYVFGLNTSGGLQSSVMVASWASGGGTGDGSIIFEPDGVMPLWIAYAFGGRTTFSLVKWDGSNLSGPYPVNQRFPPVHPLSAGGMTWQDWGGEVPRGASTVTSRTQRVSALAKTWS